MAVLLLVLRVALLHLDALGVHVGTVAGGRLGQGHAHVEAAALLGTQPHADEQQTMMVALGQADVLVRRLAHIAALIQGDLLAADGAAQHMGELAVESLADGIEVLAVLALPLVGVDEQLGLLGIFEHVLRLGQLGKDQRRVIGVMQGIVEIAALVGLDLQHFHGRLEALALLALVHIGEQPLDVAQRGQFDLAAEEIHVLLEDAHIVAAPGEQGIVLAAPGRKLIHRLQELGSVRQLLRTQLGHLADAGMNFHIMGRPDRDGDGIHHLEVLPDLHRTDLYHLKDQPVPHLAVHMRVEGHRLIPFQVHHNIIQDRYSP